MSNPATTHRYDQLERFDIITFDDHKGERRIIQVDVVPTTERPGWAFIIDRHPRFAKHEDGSGDVTTVRLEYGEHDGGLRIVPVGFRREGVTIVPQELPPTRTSSDVMWFAPTIGGALRVAS